MAAHSPGWGEIIRGIVAACYWVETTGRLSHTAPTPPTQEMVYSSLKELSIAICFKSSRLYPMKDQLQSFSKFFSESAHQRSLLNAQVRAMVRRACAATITSTTDIGRPNLHHHMNTNRAMDVCGGELFKERNKQQNRNRLRQRPRAAPTPSTTNNTRKDLSEAARGFGT